MRITRGNGGRGGSHGGTVTVLADEEYGWVKISIDQTGLGGPIEGYVVQDYLEDAA